MISRASSPQLQEKIRKQKFFIQFPPVLTVFHRCQRDVVCERFLSSLAQACLSETLLKVKDLGTGTLL